jgi:hypothetical protein
MRLLWHTVTLFALVCVPRIAAAQYKNQSFGLDAGGWLIQKPSLLNGEGVVPEEPSALPVRLSHGLRIGGESNLKMRDDRFWFIARVNVGFLQYPAGTAPGDSVENDESSLNAQYDYAARTELGTIFGVQGSIGIRYLFATDYVRPYFQFGLSYLRLMSFTEEAACDDEVVCGGDSENKAVFLPHPNIGGVHFQPGVELVFTRDVALHLFVDLQRWIVFNTDDNNAVVLGAGLLFFT